MRIISHFGHRHHKRHPATPNATPHAACRSTALFACLQPTGICPPPACHLHAFSRHQHVFACHLPTTCLPHWRLLATLPVTILPAMPSGGTVAFGVALPKVQCFALYNKTFLIIYTKESVMIHCLEVRGRFSANKKNATINRTGRPRDRRLWDCAITALVN